MSEEAADREKVLHEIGKAYIDMKHNRARGYMVVIDDATQKMAVIVYNMGPSEFVQTAIRMVEDTLDDIEERSND